MKKTLPVVFAVLLAASSRFAADEVKLMFGLQPEPVRKEQKKFLDFRYVSVQDPMFKAQPRFLQGGNYPPP